MLGLVTFTRAHPIQITKSIPKQQTLFPSITIHHLSCKKSDTKNPRGFKVSFSEDREELGEKPNNNGKDEGEGNDDMKKKGGGGDERPRFNLRWSELLFDPDPDNVVAVGLTGVLAWASAQVLCNSL